MFLTKITNFWSGDYKWSQKVNSSTFACLTKKSKARSEGKLLANSERKTVSVSAGIFNIVAAIFFMKNCISGKL